MEKNGTIQLPNRFRDPYHFEDIINMQSRFDASLTDLNLSRIAFIEPYSMLALLLMGRTHLRLTGNRLRLSGMPIAIHQYLHRMDFFKTGIFIPADPLNEKLFLSRSGFSRNVLEIIEIPNKERDSLKVIAGVIALFRKRARHILRYWISDTITDYFVTVISELCQNIFEHGLDSGYVAMQTYTLGKENVVRLAIADSGVGIPGSFEHMDGMSFESPAKLIEQALTTPISSKRQFGYGLCQVNAIVEKLNGSLFIRSGNASVTAHFKRSSQGSLLYFLKNDLTPFNGTQISVTLTG